jgi:leucyl-tRNA synthetase
MPGSAGSSWYFLRFTDPHNSEEPFSHARQKFWMPVDMYVGGPEHTVGHLLYARFWQKVLFDAGLVSHDEPIQKLVHQGVIMGEDGARMSKSRGNVVNVDDIRKEYGADVTRLYISFLGPFDKDKPWSTKGIQGVRRFIERTWRLVVDDQGATFPADTSAAPEVLNRLLHKTIKKVGEDLANMNANTAISALMILVNEIYSQGARPATVLKPLVQLLAPLAPHTAEELWERLGGQGFVSLAPWPAYDPALVTDDTLQMGVQVNGKTRSSIEIAVDADQEAAMAAALAQNAIKNATDGKTIAKVIYKPGKILNIIVK